MARSRLRTRPVAERLHRTVREGKVSQKLKLQNGKIGLLSAGPVLAGDLLSFRKKGSERLSLPGQVIALRATLTGCEGRVVCWKPLLLVERPAPAARTHDPTPIHLSCVYFGKVGRLCVELRREARSKKTPLEEVCGVKPKP